MFGYYLEIAWRSLRRAPILSGLMVLAIGLGIGASMTMITVLHVMSGDPLPGRSARLFVPLLDPRPSQQDNATPVHTGVDGTPDGFTWADAQNLLREHRADRQAAMNGGMAEVHPQRPGAYPFLANGEFVTSEFFSMFAVPFRAGAGWTSEQDHARARVVVLNAKLDRKLFGDRTGIGQMVRLGSSDYRVIGVTHAWNPQPAFYAQHGHGIFGHAEEFFLPLQTALEQKLIFNGHVSCWGDGGRRSDQCTWVQFWVELDSPAKVVAYRRYLDNYWRDQQAHGRFPRKNVRPHLYSLMGWLAHEQIIPDNLSMQMWLAIGFLIVCMLSVVALLLAKFLRRSDEISVRRALGARRRDIFAQLGVESGVIGVMGGLLGLVISQFGLWSVRQRPDGYAHLAQMDVPMLVVTVVLAVIVSVLAGLLPAWRACQVPPALHLKVQ